MIDLDEVRSFRAARSAVDLRRYEHLTGQEQGGRRGVAAADGVLRSGWSLHGGPTIVLQRPVAWVGEGALRSWWFHLHSLDPLAPLLDAHDSTGDDRRYLAPAVDLAVDWVRSHPELRSEHPFAWYDMAVGLRAYRLAYLLDAAARSDIIGDDAIDALLRSILLHAEALADDDAFAAHSNHGLFQAAGQLALATRFGSLDPLAASRSQALARIRRLLDTQFTSEGVHVEHSPGYHWTVWRTFRAVLRSGLVDEPALLDRLAGIEDALAWFVKPDGHLVMFGDTTRRKAKARRAPGVTEGALGHVLTKGRAGGPPAAGVRSFPASGYHVVRKGSSYLALNAAFHSRTHKHADDLSFVWFDCGRDLLVDAGSFGYVGRVERGSELWERGFWYSHPSRVYVESTRAHNTVEVDGRSHSRRVAPYGSGIRRCTTAGNVHAVEAAVAHPGSVEHERLLVFHPGRWLLVVDRIADPTGALHDLAQRFHLAPDLDIDVDDALGDNTYRVPIGRGDRLHVLSLAGAEATERARGQESPALLGWNSPRTGQMIPSWSLAYTASGVARHHFATLLSLGTDAPAAIGAPRSADGRWSWRQGDALTEVVVGRGSGGDLALEVASR